MEKDDIHAGIAPQEVAEIETKDDLENEKAGGDPFTAEEERRLVRKLDFWYVLT